MLCEKCNKRTASVHFTQIRNDQKMQMNLCEQCAKEKDQLKFLNPISVSELFNTILGVSSQSHIAAQKSMCCAGCGMTYEQFQKDGKMGCGQCYDAFEQRVMPIIKRVHGNLEHIGNSPKMRRLVSNESKELLDLKCKLDNCIKSEEYEQAAKIRDQIKLLEKGN